MNNKEKLELSDVLVQFQQIDYVSIIRALSPIIYLYTSKKVVDTYTIHQEFKPKNINKVSLPPELTQEYSDIDIEKLASQRFGNAVIEFAKVIIDKFPLKVLTNFYNNLNELKINPKNFDFENLILKTNTAAAYNTKKNKIEVNGDNYKSTIYHELFHMASSTYKDGICYSGFKQATFKVNLGTGLNEGYTQLLTQRYFSYNEEVFGPYKFEVEIAREVEKIVGKEKMEELYLHSNLLGLINELKSYASADEIMKFISGLDFLSDHLDDKKLRLFEKRMITRSLKNVKEFLFKTEIVKLKKQLDDGILDINEFIEKVIEYIGSLSFSIYAGKHKYEVFTAENLQEILRTILDAPDLILNINETSEEPKSKGM